MSDPGRLGRASPCAAREGRGTRQLSGLVLRRTKACEGGSFPQHNRHSLQGPQRQEFVVLFCPVFSASLVGSRTGILPLFVGPVLAVPRWYVSSSAAKLSRIDSSSSPSLLSSSAKLPSLLGLGFPKVSLPSFFPSFLPFNLSLGFSAAADCVSGASCFRSPKEGQEPRGMLSSRLYIRLAVRDLCIFLLRSTKGQQLAAAERLHRETERERRTERSAFL